MKTEELKRIEQEIKDAGCSASEYCRNHGINVHNYYMALSYARKKEIKVTKIMPLEMEQELTIRFPSCECTMKIKDEASLLSVMKVLKNV